MPWVRTHSGWLNATGPDSPHILLLTDTNAPNAENRSYFGAGDDSYAALWLAPDSTE